MLVHSKDVCQMPGSPQIPIIYIIFISFCTYIVTCTYLYIIYIVIMYLSFMCVKKGKDKKDIFTSIKEIRKTNFPHLLLYSERIYFLTTEKHSYNFCSFGHPQIHFSFYNLTQIYQFFSVKKTVG